MTPDQEVIALRRQVRELTEELEEYRRGPMRDERSQLRAFKARRALGVRAVCPMGTRMILTLIDRAPQIVSNWELHQVLSPRADETDPKVVQVIVSRARKGLRAHGVTIDTAWGIGYSISRETAAKLRQLIGEATL